MSQTSLVESTSSSGNPPRPAGEYTGSLQLNLSSVAQEPSTSLGSTTSFIFKGRYIYETTASPSTAIYHVSTSNTLSGKPWQLQVSRLLPSETRRLSVAASQAIDEPLIRYDDDLTLYAGERIHVPISIGQKPLLVIRGRKRGTMPGSIILERSGRLYKFFHMIPIRHALTKAESDRMQALMHKRGYRDSDDWKKKLLLSVQERQTKESGELEWIDEDNAVLAIEKEGKLDVVGQLEMEKRDLVVACWACKNFVLE